MEVCWTEAVDVCGRTDGGVAGGDVVGAFFSVCDFPFCLFGFFFGGCSMQDGGVGSGSVDGVDGGVGIGSVDGVEDVAGCDDDGRGASSGVGGDVGGGVSSGVGKAGQVFPVKQAHFIG